MSKDSIKVRKVGKYILQKELGKGSIGKVWLSFHSGLGIPVAVKTLKPHLIEEDPEFLERFIQEGRLAVTLHHKNIVRIFDAGKSGEIYYLVMELLEGKNVLEIIEAEGAFKPERVLEIACAVTDALIEAHEHGIIHRDIKPDNIIITEEGKIKLADLGLAKKIDDEFSSTMVGSAIGTPNYMPPEQALNSRDADARSDIYALGATLYHMITGTVPFDGDSCMAVMMKHSQEELEHPKTRKPDLPGPICEVIMKMMEKDPSKRFNSCEKLLETLNRIRYAPTQSEKPKTFVVRTKKYKKPVKKIEELEARQEELKSKKIESSKKINPVLVALVTAAVLIPIALTFIGFGNSPENNNETDSEIIAKSEVGGELPKPEITPVPEKPPEREIQRINVLEDIKIPEAFRDFSTLENGVLKIIPRNQFFYLNLKGNYGNCKIVVEYLFNSKWSYGKIGLLRNKDLTTNLIFSSSDHRNFLTGAIQLKKGTGPKYKYVDAYTPESRKDKPVGAWNEMEITLNNDTLTVLVNGEQVTSFTTEYTEGEIVILAHNRADIEIRKFEIISLK